MKIILTGEEYNDLVNTHQKALELARKQCQSEFEKAKDAFIVDLYNSTDIRVAFSGIGGQSGYEAWRDRTRDVIKKLNMPK